MFDLVEVGIVCQRVAQIDSDALPDLDRPIVPGFQSLLDELQLLRVGNLVGDPDARTSGKPKDALL